MKRIFSFLLAVCAVAMFMPVFASQTTVGWYMRNDQHTVNGVTGYVTNTTQPSTEVTVTESAAGDLNMTFGIRVWRTDSANHTHEVTGGTPVAQVQRLAASGNASGIQSSTWQPNNTTFHVGFDALEVIVYARLAAGSWVAKTVFTSSRIIERSLGSDTWTVYYFTNRTVVGGSTYATFHWGDTSHNSRVTGITFTDPNVYERTNYEYLSGDFVEGIMYPYVFRMGNAIYGVILLIICGTTYIRFKSTTLILVWFIILGGAGGVFSMLIPVAAAPVAWIILMLGLAGLFWKVFR